MLNTHHNQNGPPEKARTAESAPSLPKIRIHKYEWEAADLIHNGSYVRLFPFFIPYLMSGTQNQENDSSKTLPDEQPDSFLPNDTQCMSILLAGNIPEKQWNGMKIRYIVDLSQKYSDSHIWRPVSHSLLKRIKGSVDLLQKAAMDNIANRDFPTLYLKSQTGKGDMLVLEPAIEKGTDSKVSRLAKMTWCSLLLKNNIWIRLESLAHGPFCLLPRFRTRFYLFPLSGSGGSPGHILPDMPGTSREAGPDMGEFLTDKSFHYSNGNLKITA